MNEEELLDQLTIDDVMVQTVVTLINLSGHKLAKKDPAQAKQGIDAAREMVPLCPAEQQGPIKEAISQLQMAYVQATKPEEKPKPDIWTPGSSSP